jgi:hypothetical protein
VRTGRVRNGIARLQQYLDAQVRRPLTERETASRLRELGPEWVVFEELRWPDRRFSNADHLAIGPGGIFVVDVRSWRGRATVRGGVLREDGHSREPQVRDAAEAATALAGLAAPYSAHVRPVLCLAGPTLVRGVTEGVLLCSADTLAEMLLSRPCVLDEGAVLDAATRLEERLWAPPVGAP